MATSTKSAETEEDRKPTFTFEQLVLRLSSRCCCWR
jgi:hypothetical protein